VGADERIAGKKKEADGDECIRNGVDQWIRKKEA
jgi:hypothetical protein